MGIRTKRIYQKRTKLAINEHDRRVDLGATEKQLQPVARAKLIWTRGDHVEIQRSNYSAIVHFCLPNGLNNNSNPSCQEATELVNRDRAWPSVTEEMRLEPGTTALQARGGYSQKNWVGVCGPLPKTLTLFMTKICDFPYPIYDLTKNLIPYLWPDP